MKMMFLVKGARVRCQRFRSPGLSQTDVYTQSREQQLYDRLLRQTVRANTSRSPLSGFALNTKRTRIEMLILQAGALSPSGGSCFNSKQGLYYKR